MKKRKLRQEEISLITWMIKDTPEGLRIIDNLDKLIVEEMNDGGMGSLRIVNDEYDNGRPEKRRYARDLAKVDLYDIDGVPVFISVVLDTDGNFFDLDVFKADFSQLKKFPSVPE